MITIIVDGKEVKNVEKVRCWHDLEDGATWVAWWVKGVEKVVMKYGVLNFEITED